MADSKVLTVGAGDFEDQVLGSNEPVLVDFWAPWCGPCRAIAPVVDDLAARFTGQVKVAKVNVDEQPNLSERYHVQSIPTLLLFRDGKVVDRIVGAVGAAKLEAAVRRVTQG